MQTKYLCALIRIRIKAEVGNVKIGLCPPVIFLLIVPKSYFFCCFYHSFIGSPGSGLVLDCIIS